MKRWIFFVFSAILTVFILILLGSRNWLPVPFGKLLSPQEGIWQNAEPVQPDLDHSIRIPGLTEPVEIYFDDRLVPHVFASNEADAFFAQGYLHAKFRLWQMDFQVRAAAGRLSEILGNGPEDRILNFDRSMRRLGMGYAAEITADRMQADSRTKLAVGAYAAGVNAYISGLSESALPVEYKLLGYRPEKWDYLRSALFLKYMSFDLSAAEEDFELTNAKNFFSRADFEMLYPILHDSLDPIVPRGTILDTPTIRPVIPVNADSAYFSWIPDSLEIPAYNPNPDNGSNNWALSGSKTQSGYPILCNDPHLGLNLPSLWYEIQLYTPEMNTYGASFPGSPSVIIGFNENCAWGFTNAERDVRDYYKIRFRNDSRDEYWFNGKWNKTQWRIEQIHIKGKPDLIDSVAYTVIGPVMYDDHFTGNGRNASRQNYAVRWKAHDRSNELLVFYLLNQARNYFDYHEAIKNLKTPGQNCIFASRSGDIAIWAEGEFPAKWERQGDFIMPGEDDSYFWQGMIPENENPHMVNPERGFVSSANQLPVDTSYGYYLGGQYPLYRGIIINRRLDALQGATIEDMKKLQNDNYNIFAEMARPLLLRYLDSSGLSLTRKKYLFEVGTWDLHNDPDEKGATIFRLWWDSLETGIFRDEFVRNKLGMKWPEEATLLENLLRDSAFHFVDNINTSRKETLFDVVTEAFVKATDYCKQLEEEGNLTWAEFKHTNIRHLLRLDALSRPNLRIGGGTHIINAATEFHGPSWRMIVQLSDPIQAYGIYPGGQNGNPGSSYYDNSVDSWVKGDYYKLWFMNEKDKKSSGVKWIFRLVP